MRLAPPAFCGSARPFLVTYITLGGGGRLHKPRQIGGLVGRHLARTLGWWCGPGGERADDGQRKGGRGRHAAKAPQKLEKGIDGTDGDAGCTRRQGLVVGVARVDVRIKLSHVLIREPNEHSDANRRPPRGSATEKRGPLHQRPADVRRSETSVDPEDDGRP
jgi:hypothetical protein